MTKFQVGVGGAEEKKADSQVDLFLSFFLEHLFH